MMKRKDHLYIYEGHWDVFIIGFLGSSDTFCSPISLTEGLKVTVHFAHTAHKLT